MKLRITMELEIGDLTDAERAELEDDLNFVSREKFGTDEFPSDEEGEGYTPTVPTLTEQAPQDVIDAVQDFLTDIEHAQEEFWAGTDVYARIKNVKNVEVTLIPDNRVYRMLTDAVKDKLTITVGGGSSDLYGPDYVGLDPLEAWKAIDAVEEATVELAYSSGQNVATMLIMSGLDDDEMIADFGGNWIEDWDRENPTDG